METEFYKGFKLIDIPSGMGGVLPAVVAHEHKEEYQVICLHPEYFTDWLLTVKKDVTKKATYKLSDDMIKIIENRI